MFANFNDGVAKCGKAEFILLIRSNELVAELGTWKWLPGNAWPRDSMYTQPPIHAEMSSIKESTSGNSLVWSQTAGNRAGSERSVGNFSSNASADGAVKNKWRPIAQDKYVPPHKRNQYKVERNKMLLLTPHEKRTIYFEDGQRMYEWPFSYMELKDLNQDYLDRSPFFTQLYEDFEGNYGADCFVEVMNMYFERAQFQKVSVAYYLDWLYGTRRHRDDLVDFLKKYTPKAQMQAEDDEEYEESQEYFWEEMDDTDYNYRSYDDYLEDSEDDEMECDYDMYCWTEDVIKTFYCTAKNIVKVRSQYCQDPRCEGFCSAESHGCPMCDPEEEELPRAEMEENSVEQEENTTFADQRPVVTDEGYITSQITPNLQNLSMQENEWHVRELFKKPIVFDVVEWKTTDGIGSELGTWKVPGDTLPSIQGNQAGNFVFWRGHPIIRAQLNGIKFQKGRALVVFVPMFTKAGYSDVLWSYNNYLSCPHGILDASCSNSVVIELPFVHMASYFNTISERAQQYLGELKVIVFNRLGVMTGANPVCDITMWISYENCELHQPCPTHPVMLPKLGSAAPKAEAGVEGLLKSVAGAVLPGASTILPALTKTVGNVVGMASNCDKPTDPMEIQRWVPNTVTSLNFGDGLDRSNRLSLRQGTYTIGDADLIATTQDDTNLLELCKIPTRLTVFEWQTTQAPYTKIGEIPIMPTICEKVVNSSEVDPPVSIYSPTMLAYISRNFKYWRGSIRVKVQFIVSAMQTGRIRVDFAPGFYPEGFEAGNAVNNYVVDVQERHEVEFIIPYMAERPWLRSDKLIALNQETTVKQTVIDGYQAVGMLQFYVLNRLITPDTSPQIVDINVLISAGDDFELAFVTDLSYYSGSGNIVGAKAQALVGEEFVTTRQQEGVIYLTKGGGTLGKSATSTMGEDAMDLKTITRRYYKVFENVGEAGHTSFMSFTNSPWIGTVNKPFGTYATQYRTPLAHFAELYTFWRGSLRYKLVFLDQFGANVNVRVYHVPGVFVKGNFSLQSYPQSQQLVFGSLEHLGVMVAVGSRQSSLEFEIPFYTPYTQLQTIAGNLPTATNATGLVVITFHSPYQQSDMSFQLYQAAADDFSFNYIRAAPRIQFQEGKEFSRTVADTAAWIYEDEERITEDKEEPVLAPKAEMFTAFKTAAQEHTATMQAVQKTCNTISQVVTKTFVNSTVAVGSAQEREGDSEDPEPDGGLISLALNVLANSLSDLPSQVGLAKSIVGWSVSVANLVSGLNSFVQASSLFVRACGLVTMATELLGGLQTLLRNKLYAIACSILDTLNGGKQGNQPPKAEAYFLDFVPALTATLTTAMVAIGYKKIPSDKETMDVVKTINEKLRLFNQSSLCISNIKGVWQQIRDVVETLVDKLLLTFAPDILARMKFQRGFEEIEQWTTFIDEHYDRPYTDRCNFDMAFRNKILTAGETAKRYTTLLASGKIGREASIIREYSKKALEMAHNAEQSRKDLPERIDPLCIMFFGQPGIGKSACVTSVAYQLMDARGCPMKNRWITVNLNDAFFPEKYDGHIATYFDDMSVFTDVEQYKLFFNLKANTAFTPNFAFKKGTPFTSEYLFGTSNVPHPAPNGIADRRAFLRRRDKLIEAAWATEDHTKHNDYSHLRFRFVDPITPGNEGRWMTYTQMVEELITFQTEYFANQEQRLRHTLERMHYNVPEELVNDEEFHDAVAPDDVAQEGPAVQAEALWRRIDMSVAENDTLLQMYLFDGFLEHLVWEEDSARPLGGEFRLNEQDVAENIREEAVREWNEFQAHCQRNGQSRQRILYRCSRANTIPRSLSELKGRLTEFKAYLRESWQAAVERYPWLNIVHTWPVKIAAALIAVSAAVGVGAKIAHKCYCSTVRHFGYRCSLCGRWPTIDKCLDKEWLLEEWRRVYGSDDMYEDGRKMTLEEEQAWTKIHNPERDLTEITAGTQKHRQAESGPYNDVTRGGKIVKVIANQGPYSNDTPGMKLLRTVAQNAQRTDDLLNHRIIPYMYRIRGRRGNTPLSQNCFAIGERFVLINKHFLDAVEDTMEIYHSNVWMTISIDRASITPFENKDLYVYRMPVQFHQHRNLTKHFVSEKDLGRLASGGGILVRQTTASNYEIQHLNEVTAQKEVRYEADLPTGEAVKYYVQGAWKYRAITAAGSCGSILITLNDKVEGQILGLHSAGNGVYGWAQLITREMLEGLITKQLGTPLPHVEMQTTTMIPDGHIGIVGQVAKDKGSFSPSKTSIIPTLIHGEIREPVTQPAVLSSNDPRLNPKINVVRAALSKYGQAPIEFKTTDLDAIEESLCAHTDSWNVTRRPQILTKEEAVLGCPEYEGFDRLPMNTSPGWPYTLSRPAGELGKAYLFDVESGRIKNKELEQKFIQRLEMAKLGERVESVWTCCLKDERRPKAKVVSGSTRMFVIPPVDLSLLTRMYTLDFSVAVKDNRHVSFSKVGIDPQSLEWTQLYEWLAEFSCDVVAGDFSRFDGTLPPDVTARFFSIIKHFYTSRNDWNKEQANEYSRVLDVIADEGSHTAVIAGRNVFLTHTGNKSGCPLTVIKNSVVNYFYIALAWLQLARTHDPEKASMAHFRKFVRAAIYGDDNLIAIKREVLDWYNQITIAEVLGKHGIVYTNSEKSGLTKYLKLSDATFLKSGFFDHEGITGIKVPRMAQDTIYELLNWTRIAPDQNELLESNCNDALRFAYFYGKGFFESLRRQIIASLRNHHLSLDIMTYSDFHYWFLYTIGKLPHLRKAENFLEKIAANGNSRIARMMNKVFFGLPYCFLSLTGLVRSEREKEVTDPRYAIAIPSGEGKTWLCRQYPHLFVDHDELLLPAARGILRQHGVSIRHLRRIFDLDLPINDHRVLLVHHPDNTIRRTLRSYCLPKPSWIRANFYQRCRLKDPIVLDRDARNEEIVQLALEKVRELENSTGISSRPCSPADLNRLIEEFSAV